MDLFENSRGITAGYGEPRAIWRLEERPRIYRRKEGVGRAVLKNSAW